MGKIKINKATDVLQWTMDSKIGRLYLAASPKGLQALYWDKLDVPMAESLNGDEPAIRILAKTVKQLEEYFAGARRDFDIPFDVTGTNFQKMVWGELSRIPYGQTISYKDLARKIKNDKAVRAVGTANGRNPISIIVPCHRVIAADGTLGGYGGGLNNKTILLELEKQG